MSGTPEGAVVFTDIVGFTEFTAEHGDGEALALLNRQEKVVRDALPDDARVVKDLGDGLMLWFPEAVSALGSCLALSERSRRRPQPTSHCGCVSACTGDVRRVAAPISSATT